MKGAYPVPAARHRCEETVKKSRFIATVAHAESAEGAKALITAVRAEFRSATHNCWAFVAGPPGSCGVLGMSDDGEPYGTAGRPMLNVLSGSGIGEIAVVVTRFYGGVKLGTGGLVRAYSGAVKAALESLPLTRKYSLSRVLLTFPYQHVSSIRNLLESFGGKILTETYSEAISLTVDLPEEKAERFRQLAGDLTSGRIRVTASNGDSP